MAEAVRKQRQSNQTSTLSKNKQKHLNLTR